MKILPARLHYDPSVVVEYRRHYDTNQDRIALVRKLRKEQGCKVCISSQTVCGLLCCKLTGDACARTCAKFWTVID